jgi:hypothetical protein
MKNTFIDVRVVVPKMLMHNEQLADPLNEYTKSLKSVTSKRKKTDDDHIEIARIEFQGGLYHDDKLGPYIPDKWLHSMLIEGARRNKMGKEFESFIQIEQEMCPIIYKGPRDREKLWKEKFYDRRCVGNQQNRVVRTRPRFMNAAIDFCIVVLEGGPDVAVVREAIDVAGVAVGLGDGRPRFAGKFNVEKFMVRA